MTRNVMVLALCLCAAGTVLATAAQKKAKPPSSVPTVAQFRCPSAECTLVDRISGDGPAAIYTAADGAVLNGNGEFSMRLVDGTARFMRLDFAEMVDACVEGCRRDYETLDISASEEALIQTNVLDGWDEQVENGLLSIEQGAEARGLLKVTFSTIDDSGATILWAVRFNPLDFPGSDYVAVRRLSSTAWEIEAPQGAAARLVSKQLRKRGETDEGAYIMPFKLSVTIQ